MTNCFPDRKRNTFSRRRTASRLRFSGDDHVPHQPIHPLRGPQKPRHDTGDERGATAPRGDFVIKGRAGLNYAFTRTYNSTPSATKVDLGLGYGWVHSYGMRLKSNDYGQCPNCTSAQDAVNGNSKTSSITYTDERGGDHNYLVNESTFAVTAPQGEFDSLVVDSPAAGQNTLTFRNGTKYVFENVSADEKSLAPGTTLKSTPGIKSRLKQIADPWGNQLNFTYTAAGRLATVTDNLGITGRTGLVFAYDVSNHLQTITDWSGRVWHYAVGSDGNFASYTNPLAQTRLYGYVINSHNLAEVDLWWDSTRQASTRPTC